MTAKEKKNLETILKQKKIPNGPFIAAYEEKVFGYLFK